MSDYYHGMSLESIIDGHILYTTGAETSTSDMPTIESMLEIQRKFDAERKAMNESREKAFRSMRAQGYMIFAHDARTWVVGDALYAQLRDKIPRGDEHQPPGLFGLDSIALIPFSQCEMTEEKAKELASELFDAGGAP